MKQRKKKQSIQQYPRVPDAKRSSTETTMLTIPALTPPLQPKHHNPNTPLNREYPSLYVGTPVKLHSRCRQMVELGHAAHKKTENEALDAMHMGIKL